MGFEPGTPAGRRNGPGRARAGGSGSVICVCFGVFVCALVCLYACRLHWANAAWFGCLSCFHSSPRAWRGGAVGSTAGRRAGPVAVARVSGWRRGPRGPAWLRGWRRGAGRAGAWRRWRGCMAPLARVHGAVGAGAWRGLFRRNFYSLGTHARFQLDSRFFPFPQKYAVFRKFLGRANTILQNKENKKNRSKVLLGCAEVVTWLRAAEVGL